MSIDEWRTRIDAIDRKLVGLLNERAACVIEVGGIKKKAGVEVFDPDRERQVLASVQDALRESRGPMDEVGLQRIFKQVIEECRRIECR
jgi:chorismate mutase/prephenate dehydratase